MSFRYPWQRLALLPRFGKQIILLLSDCILLLLSAYLAFVMRLGFVFVPTQTQIFLIAIAPALAIPVFIRFGLYRAIIRYLAERAIWPIFQATAIAALFWVALVFLMESYGGAGLPRSVPLLYWLLSTVLISASRFGAKWLLRSAETNKSYSSTALIIGVGEPGRQLATALRSHSDTHVIGFVDPTGKLSGMDIIGMRVYDIARIPSLIENFGVRQVVISEPEIDQKQRQELARLLGRLPVSTRILPPIADLTAGKYLVSALRNVEIDDLLGRSPVPPDVDLLREVVEGRRIMVTGAGGSIGSQLCRTIAQWNPSCIVLFESSEFALYQIERQLRQIAQCDVIPVLGTVANQQCVEKAIRIHAVDTVYHCAAYKHVPLVEQNPLVGIYNNVFGTLNVAAAAFETDVERMVLISSDKAVRPTNVMGATKRWAELVVYYYGTLAEKAGRNKTFYSVRFGNVLGSNGSVVPLFREQIANGGPVTLTHEDMTRYFMSIKEAAELIVQSGAIAKSGDTVLLEMGDPVKVRDLAENMILLAGLTVRNADNPDGDIAIEVTGIREGEKMYEELFYDPSQAQTTRHPKIMRAPKGQKVAVDVPKSLDALRASMETEDVAAVRKVLFEVITF
ncbi:polysaccharide biosynthesis protein [Brucella pseudogrignonensis]|jgi:FlaA1/EpsC-like NDP-sugar epimerase|uniref:polysaccharide biosynthesis protein n=1 Tax=Brucella pseudogrignonensis TaxID=419475 RepID=UPI000CFB4A29|nr:nucleoside-diphosphate sugar epimerase/dehydratase [Brucella pseudogrignonensis]MQP41490.1 NAD-dependent epimerase/dehydratase family protein [Ochrobactrum sp. MYb237]PQZ40049.1 polysaccharide biosynthesis protein [Brucella pseudogrignonensis]PRA39792.1 polysaccharide biosynthesis protein [Brucella pseudogrignonensis]PRA66225.1 polysaccharide biosynthesis protein [Brucella pseudogrignonensis]